MAPLSGLGEALLSATLSYDATYEWTHPTIATNEIEDIVASIHIVNVPWGQFAIAAEKIIDTAKWPGIKPGQTLHFSRPVDVSIVRGWVSGTRPNHGMLFVGRDEALPAKAEGLHWAILSNLRLTVQVAEPKKP